jgi:peptidoglycan hydrolase-like protein with peptidoglycan-binding domain
MRSSRALALAAALALGAGCAQVRKIGKPEAGTKQDSPEAADEAKEPKKKAVKAGPGRPPVPATPDALVTDEGVADVRTALARKGYLPAAASGGKLDGATAAALRRFQQDEGLASTGFPDRETLRHLGLEPRNVYRTTDNEDAQ